ncbi:T9SS type A sorting domain-containing protein [bacterium]|nr:T9SS type A sorting domain-containing protein [bacterium]
MRVYLVVAILWLVASFGRADWIAEHHGPNNPAFIATDSSGARILLSLHEYGGIWLTNDGGVSWEQINDRICESPMLRPAYECHIRAVGPAADTLIINVYPTYPDSNTSREYHSLDAGQTWDTFSFVINHFWPDSLDNLTFNGDPTVVLPDRIYYSRQSGFGISHDHGMNWTVIPHVDVESGIQGVRFDLFHPDTVYAYGYWGPQNGTWGPPVGGVIATHDGGYTWQRLTHMEDLTAADDGFVTDLGHGAGTNLHAVVSWLPTYDHPPFLFSPDEGSTWEWIEPDGLPPQYRPDSILPIPEIPGRILVGSFSNQGIWESDDGGHNWHRLYRGLPELPVECESFYRNPYSGNLYICLSHMGVYWSTDFGNSWQPLPAPPVGAQSDWYYDGFVVDEQSVFHKTHYPPIFFTDGDATSFQELQLPPIDPEYGSNFFYPLQFNHNEMLMVRTRSNLWEESSETAILSSENQGISWVEHACLTTLYNVIPVPSVMGTALVGTTDFSSVHVSFDGGNSWFYHDCPFNIRGFIEQVDGELYAITPPYSQDIIRSRDLGESWQELNFPDPDLIKNGLLTKPLRLTDTLLFATQSETWAYLPTEVWQRRGDTWDQHIEGLDDVSWAYVRTESDSFLLAGCNQSREFSVSRDHGWTWEHESVELPGDYQGEVVLDLVYDQWRDRIWVDTAMGVMYLDNPTSAVDPKDWHWQAACTSTLQVYPNPFNNDAAVRVSLDRPGAVRLSVYDLLGREVAQLYNGRLSSGDHHFSFNGDELPSGTYYLQLENGQDTIYRKLTLVK